MWKRPLQASLRQKGLPLQQETSPRPNEHTNVASLKHDTPHSKQHFDATAVSKSDDSQHQHLESPSSTTAASEEAYTTDNAPDEEAPAVGNKNMEAYIQKREDDTFWNEQELLAPSGTASTPSAYYYIRDNEEEQSNTWTESNVTERASRVPELVNASSSEEPSVISGVTYPVEIATHFPETETPEVQDLEDKSAVKKSYGQLKQAFEEHGWNVEEAIASIVTDNAADEEAPAIGNKSIEAYIQKREDEAFWNEQELLALLSVQSVLLVPIIPFVTTRRNKATLGPNPI
jgi:hypothetical protein